MQCWNGIPVNFLADTYNSFTLVRLLQDETGSQQLKCSEYFLEFILVVAIAQIFNLKWWSEGNYMTFPLGSPGNTHTTDKFFSKMKQRIVFHISKAVWLLFMMVVNAISVCKIFTYADALYAYPQCLWCLPNTLVNVNYKPSKDFPISDSVTACL